MGWVKDKATNLMKKHKTNDPFELASLMNIHVVPWDLHEEILGYYKYDKKNRYIVINSNLNDYKQRFTCTHELGHAVLHPKANTPFMRKNTLFSIDKIEVEANTFAVELLLPDDHLYEYRDTNLSIYQISEMHGVPKELSHLKIF
ncbi:ImmA/IrrE family metallo-endopeptidase [Metabacillus bambusae]|uniref:ImmA/IrrE family metallo-endopeptidase n=1 Tax=Metabacillus bambusae TaxID=2795218 RepID=A0ABS3NCL0_9BACI|nr:ImmA/IrrE family metallo-endopeptidase [Metabacillus bambusae]MBO1515678.1 ImmA/IrrE family metallo-endopeptidase [Metabacillus bambusae]